MRAKELVYSGRMVSAEEAQQLGLALEIVPQGALMPRSREFAEMLAVAAPLALSIAKRQFDLAPSMTFEQFLDVEASMQPMLLQTNDHREGVTAFRDKRSPRFCGQ